MGRQKISWATARITNASRQPYCVISHPNTTTDSPPVPPPRVISPSALPRLRRNHCEIAAAAVAPPQPLMPTAITIVAT